MTYRTTRDLRITAWGNFGAATACTFTLPAGSRAKLVSHLDGLTGDGFAVASISQLIELTGNRHDPKYRYVCLPADAIEGETDAERAAVERINSAARA